ncbi:MAG: hypothetical protein KDC07_05030 [Chitinophagaceae bacterium]|nr:hypothetical protein [Chitinophagaceae bacterium]MCB9044904.1 hypothetical protein [Chitinophagales bacterium]
MSHGSNSLNNESGTGLYGKVIAFLRKFYADLRRNIVVFLLCLIVVTGSFLGYNIKKSNSYSASFTIVYEELVRKVYGDRLEKLNNLLQNNTVKAQVLLNVKKPVIESVNEITATNILGEDLSTDMNTDKIPFIVTMNLNDTSYMAELQDAIVAYLETGNSYLISKRKLRREEIDNELEFITEQLALMDTFKRKNNVGSSRASSDQSAADNSAGGGAVYQLSYELYKRKQELLKKKEMPLNLYVIDDAIVPVKNSKSYLLVTILGLFTGFIVYLAIAYLVLPVVRYKGD